LATRSLRSRLRLKKQPVPFSYAAAPEYFPSGCVLRDDQREVVRMRSKVWWCAVVILSGCGASLQQLKTRAAIDFDCRAEDIAVTEVDGATQQASGCGKKAIYVVQFNNARYTTWLLNSDIRSQQSANR
jgi:hypothetical protein